MEMKASGPIGLYGCYCHPFNDWNDCEIAHNQKFTVNETVENRHNKKIGKVIHALKSPHKNFYLIRYGELQSDVELEHAARLIKHKS